MVLSVPNATDGLETLVYGAVIRTGSVVTPPAPNVYHDAPPSALQSPVTPFRSAATPTSSDGLRGLATSCGENPATSGVGSLTVGAGRRAGTARSSNASASSFGRRRSGVAALTRLRSVHRLRNLEKALFGMV